MKNSNPKHPWEGIEGKMSHHTDVILSPALESKKEEGLKNLGLGKGMRGRELEQELSWAW